MGGMRKEEEESDGRNEEGWRKKVMEGMRKEEKESDGRNEEGGGRK